MNRCAMFLGFALSLSPWVASAKEVCVQLDDDGDVLVLRGVGKGSQGVSGHRGDFVGIDPDFKPIYEYTPLAGAAIQTSDGDLAVGVTEYHVGPNGFAENITFHRVRCTAGADDRLNVLDPCLDIKRRTNFLPEQVSSSGHVIPCKDLPPVQ